MWAGLGAGAWASSSRPCSSPSARCSQWPARCWPPATHHPQTTTANPPHLPATRVRHRVRRRSPRADRVLAAVLRPALRRLRRRLAARTASTTTTQRFPPIRHVRTREGRRATAPPLSRTRRRIEPTSVLIPPVRRTPTRVPATAPHRTTGMGSARRPGGPARDASERRTTRTRRVRRPTARLTTTTVTSATATTGSGRPTRRIPGVSER